MKYKDILKEIELKKTQRSDFINNFDIDYEYVYDSLIKSVKNNSINSIRVHKYLTNNKKLGNVWKLKLLFFKKKIGFKFNQIELYTNGLSIFANPKTIFSSKNARE